MLNTLDPKRVGPLLPGRFGVPYLYEAACESTQRLLDRRHPEGAVAVTEHQTAGRGRLGRSWEAPPGRAILCSVLLRPPSGRVIAELSLLGGIAVARAIEAELGRECQVKWPNDVLVGGQKVAGVLAEDRDGCVVLGVGVNVNQSRSELPADTDPPAASLFTIDGRRHDRAPLLARLLGQLEDVYRAWSERGLESVRPELVRRDFLKGRHVALGGRTGTALGIAADGRLEIDFGGGRQLVASGDITCID